MSFVYVIYKYIRSYRSSISPWVRLTRVPLAILGVVTSMALLAYAGRLFTVEGLLIVLIISTFNIAFNIYNDISGIEDDRKNKPWRPLPSGDVNVEDAEFTSLFMAGVGVILSIFFLILTEYTISNSMIILLIFLLGYVYNSEKGGVVADFILGATYFMTAVLCLYPLFPEAVVFSLGFFFLTTSVNIATQIQDSVYDSKMTLVKKIGEKDSARLAAIFSITSSVIYISLSDMFWFFIPGMITFVSLYTYLGTGNYKVIGIGVRLLVRAVLIFVVMFTLGYYVF